MSFTAEFRERSRPVLPLAPMLDVMFLLLIFFMTASVFREKERQIDVSLPPTQSHQTGVRRAPIIITVAPDNTIYIGENRYSVDGLRETLTKLAADFPDESVLIRGDRQSQLETTIRVLDIARTAGLQDVSLATTKPADSL